MVAARGARRDRGGRARARDARVEATPGGPTAKSRHRTRAPRGVPHRSRHRRAPRPRRVGAVGVRSVARRAAAAQLPRVHRGDARRATGPARFRSTSISTTSRPRSARCSTCSAPRRSSITARSDRSSPTRSTGARPRSSRWTTGRTTARLPGSTSFEDAVRTPAPDGSLPVASPDDLYMVCTGGTTGSPKGGAVAPGRHLRVGDGRHRRRDRRDARPRPRRRGSGTWFAAPPLMHAAAQWTAFAAHPHGRDRRAARRRAALRRAHDPRDREPRAREP